MVTREQAMTVGEFHYGKCIRAIGPRGGEKLQQETWRRNGATKTWKTRPTHFSTPIKFGLYGYSYLDHDNAGEFHVADGCEPREIHS